MMICVTSSEKKGDSDAGTGRPSSCTAPACGITDTYASQPNTTLHTNAPLP